MSKIAPIPVLQSDMVQILRPLIRALYEARAKSDALAQILIDRGICTPDELAVMNVSKSAEWEGTMTTTFAKAGEVA